MRHLKIINTLLFSCLSLNGLHADNVITDTDIAGKGQTVSYKRTSVHDPSIVIDSITNPSQITYYIFGSHMGVSKSTDLINWTSVTSETTDSKLFGKVVDGKVVTCSYNEAYGDYAKWQTAVNNYTIQGNQWAPDVVYSKTMKKWLMYMSLNGADWNSLVLCLASDNIEGPYVCQGPVIYSGFTGKYTSQHLSYKESDLEKVLGEQSSLPSRYNRGSSWGTYWPHAIDPCVFYDEDGNLKMSYGSWSGGIYMIDLDETTGLRDYTVKYDNVNNTLASVTSDSYFGKKIAGGCYVSGEGSYIEHIGKYYYLFVSYGFYSPEGGYEMRVFRSENPDGPYVDTKGTSAIYSSYVMNYGTTASGTEGNKGVKLMGNYKWDPMSVAEIAQGHNSAMTDSKGRSFVIYHTKFNDGAAGHAVRVHQLFTNEDGWLVASPYEFGGETVTQKDIESSELFTSTDVAGSYQLIKHKYKNNYASYENQTPVNITLTADGKIESTTGYTGTWSIKEGSSFIDLKLNGTLYKGVLTRQTIDYTNVSAVCFAAVCSDGGTAGSTQGLEIWGSKADPVGAIAYTLNNMPVDFSEGETEYKNITLPASGLLGTEISWSTSNENIIDASGSLNGTGDVILTATINKDGYSYNKQYQLVGGEISGNILSNLLGYYRFEGSYKNEITPSQVGTITRQTSATSPSLVSNTARNSKVLKINFGYDSANSSDYVTFPNPLQNADVSQGVTVAMYVLRTAADSWDAIWAFKDDASSTSAGRIYMTPNIYLGYNGTYGYYDLNHPSACDNQVLGTNEWHHLVTTFTDSGVTIYIDGKEKYTEKSNLAWGASCTDFSGAKTLFTNADHFYLGYGSWWGSAPVLLDEVCIYNRALTADDIMNLYVTEETKNQSIITGIQYVNMFNPGVSGRQIFDLQGRKVHKPHNGIYVVNGRKILYSTK